MALIGGACVPAAAASTTETTPAEQSVTVALAPDGSATVSLRLVYDLSTDDERAAFESLADDAEARAATREAFASKLAGVAADVSAATGREMRVSDPQIELSVAADGSIGTVELSVVWSNLAAVEDGRLVVAEPFASGYAADNGPVHVVGPDGYAVVGATPEPASVKGNAATWVGADLSGLSVAFEPADGEASSTQTTGQPGFGAALAIAGLALVALAARRRR